MNSKAMCFALVAAVMLCGTQALQLRGGPRETCRSFRVCHNSKGIAYTSVEVFQALEPLFEELQLSPMSQYVDIEEVPGQCTSSGCCCSTPVEVIIRLPAEVQTSNKYWSDIIAEYVADTMDILMPEAVCVADVEESECVNVELEEAPHSTMRPFTSRKLIEDPMTPEAVPTTFTATSTDGDSEHGENHGSYGYYYGGYYGSS